MYSTTKEEKVFFDKAKILNESINTLTDRELLEQQTHYLRNIEKSNHRIKLNMQFWFYVAIGGSILSFLYLITKI